MNKNMILVLAVIVALLTGWLVLSIATAFPPEPEPAASGGSMSVGAPAVRTPSLSEISVTVVEKLETPTSEVSAEVIP